HAVGQAHGQEGGVTALLPHALAGELGEPATGRRVHAAADAEDVALGAALPQIVDQEGDPAFRLVGGVKVRGDAQLSDDLLLCTHAANLPAEPAPGCVPSQPAALL